MSSRGVLGVLLTGTIEAGKSSLAVELGELLARRHLPAAIVDLDWLGWFEPPAESGLTVDELIATNLEAVWPNFRDAGAHFVVLTRAIRSAEQVARYRRALEGVPLRIVRVTASPETIETRLRARDQGATLAEHLDESVEFARTLDALAVEDFRISTDGRAPEAAALELLHRLEWG